MSRHDSQPEAGFPPAEPRRLGVWDATALGVGGIIGGGIFATLGTAALGDGPTPGAGPSVVLSFAMTAAACALPAFCFAELASMLPGSGSAYSYARACFGRWVGFVIGWDLVLEYTVANVAVAVSWGRYFRATLAQLGVEVPAWLAVDWPHGRHLAEVVERAPRLAGTPLCANLLAASVIVVLTALLVWGPRASLRLNSALVVLKVALLILFVALIAASWWGDGHGLVGRWQPFFVGGQAGLLRGCALVFFSYIGFDSVCTLAGEVRSPARTIPRAVLASLAICALAYGATALAFTAASAGHGAAGGAAAEPFLAAVMRAAPGARWAPALLSGGILIAQTTALLAFQVAQARVFAAMAQDGLLPRFLAPKRGDGRPPASAALVAGGVVAALSGLCDMDEMIELSNVGTLFAFAMVCLGVVVLRRLQPRRRRAFRVPGPAWGLPAAGLAACLGLMVLLPPASWARFAAWLAVGAVLGGLAVRKQPGRAETAAGAAR